MPDARPSEETKQAPESEKKYGKPVPRDNPWDGKYGRSDEAGVMLGVCEHCDVRTWVLKVYIDSRIPRCECAHCSAVWEGDQIIEPPNLEGLEP